MYVTRPERARLRQGDLCLIDPIPHWDVRQTTTQNGREGEIISLIVPRAKQILSDARGKVLVAVCSQCCDLENQKGHMGVAIAPVRPIPLSPNDSDRRVALMSSGRRTAEGAFSWIHLFPLTSPLDFQDGVIDWSAISTMAPHRAAIDDLLAGKGAQLKAEVRQQFRQKLAALFGRKPSEG